MFLFIKSAITGERPFVANFIILGPMPSNPVARIYDWDYLFSSKAGYIKICIIWNLIVNIINKFSKI